MRNLAVIASILVSVATSGCVLIDSANEFPYTGPLVIISFDTGNGSTEEDTGPRPDLAPPPVPELIFTEILIDTSDSQAGLGDRGEYVEIKNVGEGPASPHQIVMLLSDPTADEPVSTKISVALPAPGDERAVYDSLQPIEPGEYFTFVRFETKLVPVSDLVPEGSSYDYGAFANGPTFADTGTRQLVLTYIDPRTPEPTDIVRWQGGQLVGPDGAGEGRAIDVDMALGVDLSAESADANDDPKNWCVPGENIGEGDVHGTPGAPTMCEE